MLFRIASLLLLIVGYAVSVVGASYEWPMAGPLVIAFFLAAVSFTMNDPARQLAFVATLGVFGTIWESGMIALDVYSLPVGSSAGGIVCPMWCTALWLCVALVVTSWGAEGPARFLIWALVGAVAAPAVYLLADSTLVAYLLGDQTLRGAIYLHRPVLLSMLLLSVIWQVMLPGLVWLARSPAFRPRSGTA